MFNDVCFKFLKKICMIMAHFTKIGYFLAGLRSCQLFPGLSQVVSYGFKSFQVFFRFSKYIDVVIKNSL